MGVGPEHPREKTGAREPVLSAGATGGRTGLVEPGPNLELDPGPNLGKDPWTGEDCWVAMREGGSAAPAPTRLRQRRKQQGKG